MLIKANTLLKNMDGDVMKDMVDGEAIDATLKSAMVNAILSPVERESGMDKVKKYELAKRIHNATDEVELSAEEITLVKERIADVFPALIVGQCWDILEGKEV